MNWELAVNIALLAAAYLIGSVPSAIVIGKNFYGIDVREHGSRNAGATNTYRILGRRAGLTVFLMDMSKGYIAVLLAGLSFYFAGSNAMFNLKIALTAAAVLGHIYPIFAGFRGGKGVATLAGAVLAIHPDAVILCLITFLVVLFFSNYVSLSSMIAGVSFPIYLMVVFRERSVTLIVFGFVLAALLIFTHRKNIKRLLNGTESKIFILKRRRKKP